MQSNKCFLLLIGLIYSINLFGQSNNFEKLFEILPPSPNAASIAKFGGIEPSLATGAASFQIPLYEFQSTALKLPISISYYSTGFKVDEISSRVGTGWNLNAGGAITRTVFGLPDEETQYLSPPANLNTPFTTEQKQYLDLLVPSSVGYSSNDAQADLFNFNFCGYTGQFILDQNRNPILLNHSALKIERYDVNGSGFKITTPDGTQYFFGGYNATESSKSFISGAGCSGATKFDANFKATAWYLYQVLHPNNDVLTFSYEPLEYSYPVGRSEHVYKIFPPENVQYITTNCQPGRQLNMPLAPPDTYCINNITVKSVILKEISSSLGNKVTLEYMNRMDCNDKLLYKLSVFAPGTVNAYRIFDLTYLNSSNGARPFLIGTSEKSSLGNILNKYSFSYNDVNSVPATLSYSQDHWGYYNGKQNSTLIPLPKTFNFQQNLPSATANREPDPNYCKKGMLSAITYPTGGIDSIFYEGNQVYKSNAILPNPIYVSATQSNTSLTISESSSIAIPITYDQTVTIYSSCAVYDQNSGINPSGDTWFEIINQTTNTTIFSFNNQIGQSSQQQILLTAGNTYKIKMHAGGQNITGTAYLNYLPNQGSTQFMNINSGGVRVSKVVTKDGNGNDILKRYLYSKLSTPGISSGVSGVEPFYEEFIKLYGTCDGGSLPLDTPPLCYGLISIDCYSSSSNSWASIYTSGSSPTIYSNVVESYGQDFQNGGIEHEYTTAPDRLGYIHLGQQIRGIPLTNYAYKNGLEIYRGHFKKTGSNYVPTKKIFTHYKEDSRIDEEYKNYVANRKYIVDCASNLQEHTTITAAAYDCSSYSRFRKWLYIDSIKTRTYDINGLNYTEELEVSEYSNPGFPLLTRSSKSSSDGTLLTVSYKYPFDFSTINTYAQMISKYMVAPIIEEAKFKNSSFVESTTTNFKNWINNVFAPDSIVTKTGSYPSTTRIKYWDYDPNGNVLSLSKKDGPKNCFIWGYGGKFPIAQVINMDYSVVKSILGETAITNFRNNVNPTDAQVALFIAPLRAYINQGNVASIKSFTYNLMTNVTSQTDAKGQTTYYEYDEFQRMKNVKDQNGNILKNNIYHYKP